MINNRNYYTTSSNYASTIPTREEFHKFASNLISISDFDTDHSNGKQVEKVGDSIKWSIKYSKKQPDYKTRRIEKHEQEKAIELEGLFNV